MNNKARVRPRMVQMLLEARADMTRRRPGGSGQMPLHAAVSTGNEVVVDILLAAKADPFALNRHWYSCADLAHALRALASIRITHSSQRPGKRLANSSSGLPSGGR